MDRIKRLSIRVLEEHKGKFGTNFEENKKVLDNISIIRSKGLKNELAGFITKFIKHEEREKEEQKIKEEKQLKEQDKIDETSTDSSLTENTTESNISNPQKQTPDETTS